MTRISESSGLRATVWLVATYICFLLLSTQPWQPAVTGDAPASVPMARLAKVASFEAYEAEATASALALREMIDRSGRLGDQRTGSAAFAGAASCARIDANRRGIAQVERELARLATDLARDGLISSLQHLGVRGAGVSRFESPIPALRSAAVMASTDVIDALIEGGLEAAAEHMARAHVGTGLSRRRGTSF